MKKIFLIFFTLAMSLSLFYNTYAVSSEKGKSVKVKITVGNETVTATMYDNPTSRDFVSLLPLTLELKDYSSTEKISDLPKKLSVKDAPSGSDPLIGDITYYAPWGNLALFYKDFSYSNGLIKLGKIDSGMDIFNSNGLITAKFEIVE